MTDADLNGILNQLYRPEATVGPNGSTADVLREEKASGKLYSKNGHDQKAEERQKQLEKWQSDHPSASPSDKAAAQAVIADLKDAIAR